MPSISSLIPGTQKIWIKTWGCSHNNSDGEYMAGQLAASGYKMTGTTLFYFDFTARSLVKNRDSHTHTTVLTILTMSQTHFHFPLRKLDLKVLKYFKCVKKQKKLKQ